VGNPATDRIDLPRLKGCFPFRLGTTSYILPDEILPNVEFLGQYLDEIELVLFESGSQTNLPAVGEVREMARVASELGVSYNVHLPSDLFWAEPDPAARRRYCETAYSFYERTLPLSPSCHVLHLDSRKADGTVERDLAAWGDRVSESLAALGSMGMKLCEVAVENLEYPLQRLLPFVKDFDLSLCLDIGHLLFYGYDIGEQTTLFPEKIRMVHLHGVDNGKDHKGIHHIAEAQWRAIRKFLEGYRGGLSIEVFSLDNLAASLGRMAELAMVKKEKRR
jgi:sugar phosphate isomerase/epimerase